MKCAHCGAPLPLRSSFCAHCRTAHDADLRVLARPAQRSGAGERRCPRCAVALETWRLALDAPVGKLELDRCASCAGLFFDLDELEAVLGSEALGNEGLASPEADQVRLAGLLRETNPGDDRKVRYVPCPVCGVLMHRRGFGARSGVVVDRCREHGVWLDGGELRSLLHWRRAGGEPWDEAQRREVNEEQARAERVRERTDQAPISPGRSREQPWWYDLVELVSLLSRGIGQWRW